MKSVGAEKEKILSVQGLRTIAYIGIFLNHTYIVKTGFWGVSVFIILSGFMMTLSYFQHDMQFNVKSRFLLSINKIKKLYPLHVVTLLVALILDLIKGDLRLNGVCLAKVLLGLSLTQAWIPSRGYYFSLNGVSWYLSVCILLYFLFPTVLCFIKKKKASQLLLMVLVIYILQIVLGIASLNMDLFNDIDNFTRWFTYICPLFRFGDFTIGCCVCGAFLNNNPKMSEKNASVLEVLLCFVLLITLRMNLRGTGMFGSEWFKYNMIYTPTSVALVFLCLINKGVLSKILSSKPMVYLGNISPYTFLIHQIVIRYIDYFSDMSKYLVAILAFCITIVLAELYKRMRKI